MGIFVVLALLGGSMDHLARLIFLVVALACLLSMGDAGAHGNVPKQQQKVYSLGCDGTVLTGASAQGVSDACSTYYATHYSGNENVNGCIARKNYKRSYTVTSESVSEFTGHLIQTITYSSLSGEGACTAIPAGSTIDYGDYYGSVSTSAPACVGNSTADSTGACYCNAGFKPSQVGDQCAPVGDCSDEVAAATAFSAATDLTVPVSTGAGPSTSFCLGGCTIQGSVGYADGSGGRWVGGPFTSGGYCQGGKASGDTFTQAPQKCTPSKCPGTVNGASVCVPCTASQQGPSSAASAASGAASPNLDNVPGAVSKDSTTTCDGVSCTVTTNYRDSSGAVVQTKADTKDQGSFCKDNPGLQICKNSAINANCQSFSCDGDAVQCAIARQTYKTACDWETRGPLNDVGDAALNGGTRPPGHPGLSPDAVPMDFGSAIDQTEYFAGGGLTDLVVPLGSSSITVPFSMLNGSLAMLGNIMVGLCMLGAAFIVFRS